jgi:hypothetical protein
VHSETLRSRPTLLVPAAWAATIERLAAALGTSMEIWNAPGQHGQRLCLGAACHACQQQEPRTFDRCRKRRAYLNRPEAPVPVTLTEKCPHHVRLARLGQEGARKWPSFFAFGYEPGRDVAPTDAAMLAFLQDLRALLGSNQEEPEATVEEIRAFFQAAHDAAPGPAIEASDLHPWSTKEWVDLCRRRLDAKAVCLWERDDSVGIVSVGEAATAAPPEPAWSALCRAAVPAWEEGRGEVHQQVLDMKHSLAQHFGEPLCCISCGVPGKNGDEALVLALCTIHGEGGGERQDEVLQDLARLWRQHVTSIEAAQTSMAILSDTFLALAKQREGDTQRGRTQRVRCLALLLAQALELGATERAALHWACLLRGIGEGRADGPEPQGNEEQPMVAAALHWENLPWGKHCRRILERASTSGASSPEVRISNDSLDRAGDCLVVSETFDDLLSRGGSYRPRSLRAAIAFLEAGSGIAFDPATVKALGALEPALIRHAWIFLLGRPVRG